MIKNYIDSLINLFLYSKFRSERHFIDAYENSFTLKADKFSFKARTDGNYDLSATFGNIELSVVVVVEEKDGWHIIKDFTDGKEYVDMRAFIRDNKESAKNALKNVGGHLEFSQFDSPHILTEVSDDVSTGIVDVMAKEAKYNDENDCIEIEYDFFGESNWCYLDDALANTDNNVYEKIIAMTK